MRRFEGGKDRFWEIRIDDTTVHTRSGKIGTNGKANAPKKLASRGRAEQDVDKRASALAKGRELAKPKLWPTLGRADDTYWGKHRGSDLYEVYVRVPSLENGCSCPSGKRPCKHTIALAILVSSGHAFEARSLPSGLTSRASSSRYYGAGE